MSGVRGWMDEGQRIDMHDCRLSIGAQAAALHFRQRHSLFDHAAREYTCIGGRVLKRSWCQMQDEIGSGVRGHEPLPSDASMGSGFYRGKIARHGLGGSRQRPTHSLASSMSGERSRSCLPALRRMMPLSGCGGVNGEMNDCSVAERVQNLRAPTVNIPMTGGVGASRAAARSAGTTTRLTGRLSQHDPLTAKDSPDSGLESLLSNGKSPGHDRGLQGLSGNGDQSGTVD